MLCVVSEKIIYFLNKQTNNGFAFLYTLRFSGETLRTMVSSWLKKNAGGRGKARVFRSSVGHMCFLITIWKTTVSVFPCALWEWLFPTNLQTCNQSLFRHHKSSWWLDWVRVLVFSLPSQFFNLIFCLNVALGKYNHFIGEGRQNQSNL